MKCREFALQKEYIELSNKALWLPLDIWNGSHFLLLLTCLVSSLTQMTSSLVLFFLWSVLFVISKRKYSILAPSKKISILGNLTMVELFSEISLPALFAVWISSGKTMVPERQIFSAFAPTFAHSYSHSFHVYFVSASWFYFSLKCVCFHYFLP